MNFVFRADASKKNGTGHILRCLAIAEEAISRGINCTFVGNVIGLEWVNRRIFALDFTEVYPAEDFELAISNDAILIVDSYELDSSLSYLKRKNWKRVVSITDPLTPHYDADLSIHLGLDGRWGINNISNFLYGPKYIPIRSSIRARIKKKSSNLGKVTVYGGGSDPSNLAMAIASAIAGSYSFEECTFFSIENSGIESFDERFKVLPFGPELDDQLKQSDLVLTTASTSCFEILALGLPLGVASAVINQNDYYAYLSEREFACPVGRIGVDGVWNLDMQNLTKLFTDSKYREKLVLRSEGLIDNYGAQRIVDAVLELL